MCRKFAKSKHHVYLFLYHLWNNQVGIKLSDHLVGSQKSFDHMSLSGAFPHMSPRFVLQFLVNFTLRGRHRGEDLVLKLLGSILGTWRVSGVVLGRWGLAHWSSTFKFNYIHMKKNNGWMVDKSTVSDFANEPKPLWEKNISEKHWNLTKKTSKFDIWCRIIWQVSLRPKTSWLVGAQCNLTKKKSMTLTCLTPCSNDFWPRMHPRKTKVELQILPIQNGASLTERLLLPFLLSHSIHGTKDIFTYMKTIKLNPWWREICHTWMVWVYWAGRNRDLHQTAHFNTRQTSRIFATRHGIVGKEIRFQSGTGHVFEKHQSTLPPEQPFEKTPSSPPILLVWILALEGS